MESVGVDVLDVGGGFNNAASSNANFLSDQLGGTEGVGEDEVIQPGDAHRRGRPARWNWFHNNRRKQVRGSATANGLSRSLTGDGVSAESLLRVFHAPFQLHRFAVSRGECGVFSHTPIQT